MQWKDGRRSSNVEDLRGKAVAAGAAGIGRIRLGSACRYRGHAAHRRSV
jgi:hypothetical protein